MNNTKSYINHRFKSDTKEEINSIEDISGKIFIAEGEK